MSHESAVYKYLTDSNRPYSCVDIVTNLRGTCGKTAAQKALDALVAAGRIREKQYGKQKVYVALQDEDCASEDPMKELEAAYGQSTLALKDAEDRLRTLDSQLRELVSTPTTTEAAARIGEANERVRALAEKLTKLKENKGGALTREERDEVLGQHAKTVSEYRKRKRLCMDILDAVLEGYPKSKKDLMDDICLETDESVDFQLKVSSTY